MPLLCARTWMSVTGEQTASNKNRLAPEAMVRQSAVLSSPELPPFSPDCGLRELEALLARLYILERAAAPDNNYMTFHARPKVIRGQVRAFQWYRDFLPPGGAVLD